jgi:hypothetical protein
LLGKTVGAGFGAAVGANVAHTFDSQRPSMQSPSRTHISPIAQAGHDPPQSTSVSFAP